MVKRSLTSLAVLTLLVGTAFAHDMFLVVADHDVPADQDIVISLYNGTFDKSENPIDRGRMADVIVINGTGAISHPGPTSWTDEENTSRLALFSGPPGTMLVGVSTHPSMIDLTAEEFNEYLQHDGVLDTLEARRRDGTAGQPATERYSKHVKTLLQVGGDSSETWKRRLGYPVEFVPLSNPADLSVGDTLEVLVSLRGAALPDTLIYASFAGHHVHGDDGTHDEAVSTRTDANGVVRIEISQSGRWYLRLIHMVPVDEADVDYESNWATLTFQVR